MVDCGEISNKPKTIKCELKYIQPARPKSFKPIETYSPSQAAFQNDTIYRKSYFGYSKINRPLKIIPEENLKLCGDFEKNTTSTLSYLPIKCVPRTIKYYPIDNKLKYNGPIQDITTNKHDYTKKHTSRPKPIKFFENIKIPNDNMDVNTTHKMSYLPINYNQYEKPLSVKPVVKIQQNKTPFTKETTHKMSYQKIKIEPRQIMKPRTCYEKPVLPFSNLTIYNGSYIPPGIFVECCEPVGDHVDNHSKRAHDYCD